VCWSPSRHGALALLALLSACGTLPRPFAGNPGATGLRLSQPPPARLAVPLPTNALLTDEGDAVYQKAIVEGLQAEEVPAVADVARTGDWRLGITAEVRGDKVVPLFSVQSPDGKPRGTTEGAAIDAAQWAEASPPTLQLAANSGAPAIAALLTRIEAELRLSDPNSLVNRPARIFVPDVTGAPGDGNHQLARNLRQQMPQMGEQVRDTANGSDFTVQGQVKTAPGSAGTERIEIQWIVSDAQGREAGRVVQLNEVSPGSLDRYWGDTALAVAQEAAGGIRDVIQNQLGARAEGAKAKLDPAADKPPLPVGAK
jgi:hypothetical protein